MMHSKLSTLRDYIEHHDSWHITHLKQTIGHSWHIETEAQQVKFQTMEGGYEHLKTAHLQREKYSK